MKSVFALVVLLPLCYSSAIDFNLTKDIVTRLNTLNRLYKNKTVNITSWSAVEVPSMHMQENARSCLNVFIKQLELFLINVTIVEEKKDLIEEITGDLNELKQDREQDERCTSNFTKPKRRSMKPFQQHINFLLKLNNNPKQG